MLNRRSDEEVVSCISLKNGKVNWQIFYPAPYTMNSASRSHGKGPKSTPVISNGKLITLGISGILACWEAANGKPNWQKEFTKTFKSTSPLYGSAMSPLVSDGLCIAHVGGNDDGALIAVDLKSGKIRWQWNGDGPGYASPILVTIEDTKQVVTFSQQNIIGIDFASGALLWQMPFTTPWVQNAVTPLICENDLIRSGLSQGIMRVKIVKNKDGWSTAQVWKITDIGMYLSSPVLFDDLIVAFSDKRKGLYVAIDAKSGKVVWQSQGREGNNAALIRAGQYLPRDENQSER